ncbi:SipW-dependent-type signal peptide-containing protein [Aureisphaera galaxeae]|uniref:SipW-dependent-type signal peptide-containing protein n=1 Tax=Aureisphaera galaxeae TaxID=1538023 RepID=UPI003AF31A00
MVLRFPVAKFCLIAVLNSGSCSVTLALFSSTESVSNIFSTGGGVEVERAMRSKGGGSGMGLGIGLILSGFKMASGTLAII